MRRWIATVAAALLALPALGQDRPSEDELFGGKPAEQQPAKTPPPPQTPPPAQAAPPASAQPEGEGRDAELLGGGEEARLNPEAAPENPLQIGGQLYLRGALTARQGQPPSAWTLSAPSLFDAYFDARPNDRVRGFVLGRLLFDPTIPPGGLKLYGVTQQQTQVALDQFWVNFDILRKVYVTAGRQHVKWGTARFWTPTDYLHPVARDPLAVFDSRTGTTMVKLAIPSEQGWNLYGVALVEGYDNANTVGKVLGAARAEYAFSNAEVGLDWLAGYGQRPRYGGDVSFGLGDFDLYGDVGLRRGGEVTVWKLKAGANAYDPASYEGTHPPATSVQAAGGLTYAVKYSDEDAVTLGAEYFHNDLGYDDPHVYPFLLVTGRFTPFYLGKDYAGLFVLLPKPGRWENTSFTLSTLGNLSDKSFVTRLDYSLIVLTHLTFEAFGDVHYGNGNGEFRLGLNVPPFEVSGQKIPGIELPTPTFDVGLALRVSI